MRALDDIIWHEDDLNVLKCFMLKPHPPVRIRMHPFVSQIFFLAVWILTSVCPFLTPNILNHFESFVFNIRNGRHHLMYISETQ